jgi:hypothetical protein
MRWAPRALLGLAVAVLVVRWTRSLQWAALFVLLAYVHARCLAWRFVVSDDGVLLDFPFGHRLFIPRDTVSVRIDLVGAVLRVRGQLLRYLLFDGILYQPGQEDLLRTAFSVRGFRIT